MRVQLWGGDSIYGHSAYARRKTKTKAGERFIDDPHHTNYKYPDEGTLYKYVPQEDSWWVEMDSKEGRPHKLYVYLCSEGDYLTPSDSRWHDHAKEARLMDVARAWARAGVQEPELVEVVAKTLLPFIKKKDQSR